MLVEPRRGREEEKKKEMKYLSFLRRWKGDARREK
jgi:hypothetical protein